jgi:hemerythrin
MKASCQLNEKVVHLSPSWLWLEPCMPIVEWNGSLFIGNLDIDLHHQHLFKLLNSVYDNQKAGVSIRDTQSVIVELFDYTRYHFSYEEELMEVHAYPGYHEHKKEHDIFTERLTEILKDFKLEFDVTLEIISFLSNWITYHILKTDTKFGDFLETQKR